MYGAGKVKVKHISDGWSLTVEADKVTWRSPEDSLKAACYPRPDELFLPLVGSERVRLFENEIGLTTLEVYRA